MEIINKIKDWASSLADVGVSLIALGIVLEVLFTGQNVPFWPSIWTIYIYYFIITSRNKMKIFTVFSFL